MRHLRAFTLSLPAFVFLGLSSAALAQSADAPTHPWTVKEIFDDRSLTGDAPEGMSWSPDGTRATYIADNGDVMQIQVSDGKLKKLIDTDIKNLEKQLDAAGAPPTPGRLPDWKGGK